LVIFTTTPRRGLWQIEMDRKTGFAGWTGSEEAFLSYPVNPDNLVIPSIQFCLVVPYW
jgi:hypothetical protein